MAGEGVTSTIAVIVSFVVMIVLNGLAAAGVFGEGIGKISDENPTYVTPDGVTFAVWGLIYTLQTGLVFAQSCCAADNESLLSQTCPLTGLSVRWRIALAFVLNGVWLPTYTSFRFTLALIIIIAYLGVLISICTDLNPKTVSNSCQLLMLAAPISTNASWILVATSANLFTVVGTFGYKDEYGVAGSPAAAIAVVILVIGMASVTAFFQHDASWAGVAAWALAGIYRMQTIPDPEAFPVAAMNPTLARVAGLGSVAIAVAAVCALGLWCYSQNKARTPAHELLDPLPQSGQIHFK